MMKVNELQSILQQHNIEAAYRYNLSGNDIQLKVVGTEENIKAASEALKGRGIQLRAMEDSSNPPKSYMLIYQK